MPPYVVYASHVAGRCDQCPDETKQSLVETRPCDTAISAEARQESLVLLAGRLAEGVAVATPK